MPRAITRRRVVAAVAAIPLLTTAAVAGVQAERSPDLGAREAQVLSIALRTLQGELAAGGRWVVANTTIGSESLPSRPRNSDLLEYRKTVPSLKIETLVDFWEKARAISSLETVLSLGGRVDWISAEDARTMMAAGEFYPMFPGANGLTVVSRVGFNGDETQALVGVSQWRSDHSGDTYSVLLAKSGRYWVVTEPTEIAQTR